MGYFEKETEEVFSKIEQAESIVLFGHANPDGDCVGSVLGMKKALLSLFPAKKVYGVGTRPSNLKFIEPSDEVNDDIIRNSLAVMVDLSGMTRVEDQRIHLAKDIVCIDHHEKSEPFDYPIIRDTNAPSCTYVITKCLLNRYHTIPKDAADFLFLGLVTDTGRFQFYYDEETFTIAAILVKSGANPQALYNRLYTQSATNLRFRSYVYSNFHFDGKVAYFLVHRNDYLSLGMTEQDAGCQVNLIALLEGHPIWAEFCELENGKVRLELRSNGKYNVQKVAVKFGGGGHIPASGATLSSLDVAPEVIKALNEAEEIR